MGADVLEYSLYGGQHENDYPYIDETYESNQLIYSFSTVDDFIDVLYECINTKDSVLIEEFVFQILREKEYFGINDINHHLMNNDITENVKLLKSLTELEKAKFEILDGGADQDEYEHFTNFISPFYTALSDNKNFLVSTIAKENLQNNGTYGSFSGLSNDREVLDEGMERISPDAFAKIIPAYDTSFFGDETHGLKGQLSEIFKMNTEEELLYEEYKNYQRYVLDIKEKIRELELYLRKRVLEDNISMDEIEKILEKSLVEIQKKIKEKSFGYGSIKLERGEIEIFSILENNDPFSYISSPSLYKKTEVVQPMSEGRRNEEYLWHLTGSKSENRNSRSVPMPQMFDKDKLRDRGLTDKQSQGELRMNLGWYLEESNTYELFIKNKLLRIDFREFSEKIFDFPVGIGKEYVTLISEIIGSGLGIFLGKKIGVTLSELPILTQIFLIKFLSTSNTKEVEEFKKTLAGFSSAEIKVDFLTTFLACSQNIELGNSIIELAGYEGSEKIFKAYAQLVHLQDTPGFETFIRNILKRGESLLGEAYKYGKENGELDSLTVDKRYSDELVVKGLLIKKLFKNSKTNNDTVTIDEFNEANLGFSLKLRKGDNLIKEPEAIEMMSPENYIGNDFSKKHFNAIIGWIEEAHNIGDKDFIKFASKYMGGDFNNSNSNFLFLEEDNGELAGVCKIQKKEDGKFYYGTHYLRSDLRGDFSLGNIMQKMLEDKVSKGSELSGATMLSNIDVLVRQIEYSGGIGESIIVYEMEEENYRSAPFLGFTLNSKENYTTKKKSVRKIADFHELALDNIKHLLYNDDFSRKSKALFEEGYKLTRILLEGGDYNMLFEKL